VLELLVDPFTCAACGFMQRALLAGVLTGLAAAVVGTWVVLRGLTFMGDAVAHGVLPGIAVAYVLGANLALGGAVSALVMILAIAWVGRHTALRDDAAIGLLFVGMLALGIVLISREGAYAGDLTSILFGDAVGVTTTDVVTAGIAAAVALVVTVVLHRPFLALAFNEDTAELLGLRPRLAHVAQLALLAGVVVLSFRTVGTLLVFALVVAPPATAALLARRVPTMMVVAAGLAGVAVVAGLLASYHLGTAASASMALASVLLFVVVVIARDVAGRFRGVAA
jgi:ABC-type Mn2+/Zn2+ transport system permease subunit